MNKLKKVDKIYLIGAGFLFITLLVAGGYLLIQSSFFKQKTTFQQGKYLTYTNDQFGYSVKYLADFSPNEVETDHYLNFVVFLAPAEAEEAGFGLSVRENTLQQEIENIKEEINYDVAAKLVGERQQKVRGHSGYRLEYEPETEGEGEERVVVIVNNGKYSYTISSTPDQIDDILSTLDLND